MKNLLGMHGRSFKTLWDGVQVSGKITVENGHVFLCQDVKNGARCCKRWGFKYSWNVDSGSMCLDSCSSTWKEFTVLITKADVDSCKDWSPGDKITMPNNGLDSTATIFMRLGDKVMFGISGERLVLCDNIDSLYSAGSRPVHEITEPEITEPEITELTLSDIAKKFGIPVDNLRVKE